MSSAGEKFDPSTPVINTALQDHHCFGCGDQNPIGLQLRFRELDGGGVWADLIPDRRFEGYHGMLHGGILSTMLDEAMSWAVMADGNVGVTARMTVRFREPAAVEGRLRVVGRVTGSRSRVIDAAAEVFECESGDVIAEAEARFMRVKDEHARQMREAYQPARGSAIDRATGGS